MAFKSDGKSLAANFVLPDDDVKEPDEVATLRAIVAGTARTTGEAFFRSLVKHLAEAVGTRYAFVAEFAGENRVRSLAYWFRDKIIDNEEWDLPGTPCEEVVKGSLCHYPSSVYTRFPTDRPLVKWRIESYLGVPLLDEEGEHLGHLAVFDEKPMPAEPKKIFTFHIFAARAAAELERLRFEQRLIESERRYRDLYEEAPIGYHSTGIDGRVITVNRRVTEWLGYSAEELIGSPLQSYAADSEAGKPRAEACFRKFLAGEEIYGTEIELRRKDGRPLWVTLWVKPIRDSHGQVQVSRSIWVDITDRVLAEQEKFRLQEQNIYLQEEIQSVHNFQEIIGQSPALTELLDHVRQVAATDSTVLITGETGTGKELIARAIHSNSRRRDKPLIKINCAALPTGLVESELFGHEKGAFTGAIARRTGRFELADGGTIFLDEIGEIPPDAQAKLLRVLQEHEFDRVGGRTPIKVDVRVIAATNRDLLASVRAKTFRDDLYYRLNVFPLQLPPLRHRADDIPLLVHFLVDKFANRIGKRIDRVSKDTMQRLTVYPWPGNVRELENIIERAVILAHTPILEIDAKVLAEAGSPLPSPYAVSLQDVEREHILRALQQTDWQIDGPKGAARILDLHPNTLRSRLKKLGLIRPSHEPS